MVLRQSKSVPTAKGNRNPVVKEDLSKQRRSNPGSASKARKSSSQKQAPRKKKNKDARREFIV